MNFETFLACLLLSFVGIIGVSFLCPLIGWAVYAFQSRRRLAAVPVNTFSSQIDVIIPAHDEASTLGDTLRSIQRAIDYLHMTPGQEPWPDFTIQVGADSCTDKTAEIAGQFPNVQVVEFPYYQSKWLTLKALCLASKADWIILVDAGTLWPEDFLLTWVPQVQKNPQALAACPAYIPSRSGWVHRFLWALERLLKRVETLAGGPVSVHGATAGYQAGALQSALHKLGRRRWLNDDVAVPLILRAMNLDGVILYPVGCVVDQGIQRDSTGWKRRSRILMGNLEWVGLLPFCFRMNPVAGVIALRRLFRMLWAYWTIFAAVALAWIFDGVVWAAAGVVITLLAVKSLRELAAAAGVSLLAPFKWLRSNRRLQEAWK